MSRLIINLPLASLLLISVLASPRFLVAQDRKPGQSSSTEEVNKSNVDMQHIYDEDQKARQQVAKSQAEGLMMFKQDGVRRTQVRDLLARDALHTATDFEQAAYIFQHGAAPEDYLLAHTLAMVAVSRGDAAALWIATATLDRYLSSIKQPQIYGTQFNKGKEGWTQEPYDRTLISDALRQYLGVQSQAEQQKQLATYRSSDPH